MGTLKVLSLMLVLAMAVVLIMAAIRDSRHYIIDNRTVMIVLLLAVIFHAAQFLLPADARVHPALAPYLLQSLALAVVVFAVTAGLFALGLMGGGDVKLITAMMIWCGPALAPGFLLLTALAGGLVSAVVLMRVRLHAFQAEQSLGAADAVSRIVNPLSPRMTEIGNSATTSGPQKKVPYGLGICVGGLYVAWILFQQTAGMMG